MSVVDRHASLVRPGPNGEITRDELDERLAHALAAALVSWVRRQATPTDTPATETPTPAVPASPSLRRAS